MLEYLPYIWVAVAVLAIICEAMTAALVSVWFIPAALVSMVLAFLGVAEWIQILVFFVVAFIMLIMTKTIFKKFFKVHKTLTNVDSLIGKKAMVTEDIDNLRQHGAVKLEGKTWTARATDDMKVFLSGELVTVDEIKGVKLICK